MFRRKKQRLQPKAELVDAKPCQRKSCRYFTYWLLEKGHYGTILITKTRAEYFTWESAMIYCLACKYYKGLNCYKNAK